MTDPIQTALDTAKTDANALARQATGATQGWLRRNVWGLLGVAATGLLVAALTIALR